MTEQELIISLCKGEETAFRVLVETYQDRVYNLVLGYVQNEADAEDIAQEVFIQIFRSIRSFKGNSKLSTWIYRIAVAKSLDLIRSRKRKKRFGFVRSLFGDSNELLYDHGDFNHPGVLQENKEEARVLFRLVNELPEKQRTAFLLNKVEELSYREIAVILKTTEPAVDALLQRAKQNLRKKLTHSPP